MAKRKLARQTTKGIKEMNGKESINSGAINQDNDFNISLKRPICWGTWDRISGESKFTEKKSYSITNELLKRIAKEGRQGLPVLHLGFVNATKQDEYIVMRKEDFQSLLKYMNDTENHVDKLQMEIEDLDGFDGLDDESTTNDVIFEGLERYGYKSEEDDE